MATGTTAGNFGLGLGIAGGALVTTFPVLAYPMIFLGVGLMAFDAFDWYKSRKESGIPIVNPSALIVVGGIGAWLSITILLAGVIWLVRRPLVQPKNISGLQSQLADIEASLDRYVKPRTLTDKQIKDIVDYLLPREHHSVDIVFYQTDEESTQYAGALYNALREADWKTSMIAAPHGKIPGGGELIQGLHCRVLVGSSFKGGKPKAMDLLDQAFRAAGVMINGSGVSGVPQTAQKTEDTTLLLVGRRPMRLI